MRDVGKILGITILVAALVTAGAYTEENVWNECRAVHSWVYCVCVLLK